MTAESLYEMVSKWPTRYVYWLVNMRQENKVWYAPGHGDQDELAAISPNVAAKLLCHFAESVLASSGILVVSYKIGGCHPWTVEWLCLDRGCSIVRTGENRIDAINRIILYISGKETA
jgi:hypothetical protein